MQTTRPRSIPRRANRNSAPLSFAQQRLWFLDQLQPGSPLYNIPHAVRMRGPLDVTALQKALEAILDRHEALRTTFPSLDGVPMQVIGAPGALELPVLDLREWSDAQREEEVERLATVEARRPFALSRGPLLRGLLLRTREEEHVLVLTIHHIVSDAWSTGVFFRELAAYYTAFCDGEVGALPELPIQYGDFAAWQGQWLQGEALEQQVIYWKNHLTGAPARLELPTDRLRPAVQSHRGVRVAATLPFDLATTLKTLSRREGVTLFMTLLAAFQVLLFRYTGQEDLVIGAPIAGRTFLETEGLIGFFVNTLPLRTDLAGNPTFRELLTRVREVALGAYAYQDIPFEKLVEELQPDRDLSSTPLFQVMFILQNAPRRPLQLPGLTLSPFEVDTQTAKFDLTLSITEVDDGLRAIFEYSTDLFERATIDRMLEHFQTLLDGIANDPDQPIARLPLLTASERQQQLLEWNPTQSGAPQEAALHEPFEAQVAMRPDAVAVVGADARLTYAALNRRANQLAHYLRKQGVGAETLVGICLERSPEMVVAVLGVLKAGGAYLPLDPAYPRERLAFLLEDAQVSVLLTQERLLRALPEQACQKICLDTAWEGIGSEAVGNVASGVQPHNLAYVIYTSGSTGRPKGVAIMHQSAMTLVQWAREVFDAEQLRGVLASTSLCFDLSVFELFVPLSCGGSVVLAENALQLPSLPAAQEVTLLNTVPSVLTEVLPAGGLPASVRTVNLAGEALPSRLVRQLYGLETVERVFNLYGPTESTVYSSWARMDRGEEEVPPIGRPIAATQMYVLDRLLQPVPIGIPGELYIGGMGLARGYLNRPGLTAEKFIPHPFGPTPGARLYQSGDLARYRPDGNLEYLGRLDQQVKVRGFRIELGEVEATLDQHPAVRTSVVVAREDLPGDVRLTAYIVPSRQPAPAPSELRSFLAAKLPDYMVPAVFVPLGALPPTPNGKLDRRALPMPDHRPLHMEQGFVASRNAVERRLAQVWEQVLGVQPIGARDGFFELGGHSLLAVRLFARIERAFGRRLPLSSLFQAQTIEAQARLLSQDESVAPWASLVPIQPDGTRPPFFCVHAHEGHVLYFRYLAAWLGPDQPFYGLQARELDGMHPPHTCVEDMAAQYIREIQSLQPEGPYHLGANCGGGLVAFEMAQQLHAQGQEVGVLALIDTHAHGCHTPLPHAESLHYRTYRMLQKLDEHWGNLALLGPREQMAYLGQAVHWLLQSRLRRTMQQIASRLSRGGKDSLPESSGALPNSGRSPLSDYVPRLYRGRVTLFRPSKQAARYRHDPQFGWGRLAAGGVDVHVIPGYHGIIHEPRVRLLAERLQSCLAKPSPPRRAHPGERTRPLRCFASNPSNAVADAGLGQRESQERRRA